MNTSRLLVVGGSGFIGRHIALRAMALNWDVTSLSLSGRAPQGAKGIAVNIGNRQGLRTALADTRFEYVVNCGGYIDHTLFNAGGRKLIESHFDGTLNLIEALDRETLRSFINIGSSDEYGNVAAPQAEAVREAPISPYSMGKAAATHFLQMMNRTERMPTTTLRLFLTYGPGQATARFIPQIIRGCLNDAEFPTSSGEQLRDFCFIEDTVDAVFLAMSTARAHGEVLNVASGHPVAIRQMIENVRMTVGRGRPQFGKVPYRPGENMALYADVSKAKEVLGWTPRTSLEDGLRKTIAWMETQS